MHAQPPSPPTPTTPPERRALRFHSTDDMLAEARRCAAPPRIRSLGNWSLGQALNHIAAWIDFPYTGYPAGLDFPEELKAQAAAVKHSILHEPMQPGMRLPGLPHGTLATEDVPVPIALARLEAAAARLRGEPLHPDPFFGPVTAHEWTLMSLRHAELHLGFFLPA